MANDLRSIKYQYCMFLFFVGLLTKRHESMPKNATKIIQNVVIVSDHITHTMCLSCFLSLE